MNRELIRLSKLMSVRGICSRREADRYIQAGQVRVNGVIVSELGSKVLPTDLIQLDRAADKQQKSKVTILLNKPIGYVSTQPEKGYREAKELITPANKMKGDSFSKPLTPHHLSKLSVAGRLDIDSKGLLVFTQDGVIAKLLIGEDSQIEKEYLVRISGEVNPETLCRLRHGLHLDGSALRPAKIDLLEPGLLRFILNEGKKRQIRRMCELVGLRVASLKRVRIGRVTLSNLPEGQWRFLADGERF